MEEAQRSFTAREWPPHPHRCMPQGAEGIIARMEHGTFDWTVFDLLDVDVPVLRVDTSAEYTPDLDTIFASCREAPACERHSRAKREGA